MSYIPGDVYYKIFVTNNISGISNNTDAIPLGVLVHNGIDDNSAGSHVYVSNIDTGRYNVSGIIPTSYLGGNSIALTISGSINGSQTKSVFDLGVLDRPVSVTGISQVNVVTISGVPVAAPNISGAIIADVRYINGIPSKIYNGIAQSGGTNWIQLDASSPSIDNYYKWVQLNIVGGQGVGQWGFITSYSGATRTAYISQSWLTTPYSGAQYTFTGLGLVNNEAIQDQVLSGKVGTNFNTFFQDGGLTTTKTLDNMTVSVTGTVMNVLNVINPVSTTGTQTFTGTASITGVAPANFLGIGSIAPGVTVSVTGTTQANVIGINPGLTVSITGAITNVLNVLNPVSVTGTIQSNIVGINPGLSVSVTGTIPFVNTVNNPVSTTGVNYWTTAEMSQLRYKVGIDGSASAPNNQFNSKLELSSSGVRNVLVENGVDMTQWMSLIGAVIAGSSTVAGNVVNYYAVNNNGTLRLQSTAVSGARQAITIFLPSN